MVKGRSCNALLSKMVSPIRAAIAITAHKDCRVLFDAQVGYFFGLHLQSLINACRVGVDSTNPRLAERCQ